MTINEVEVFDVDGDGTLVIKTNLDNTYEQTKFAWYIVFNGQTIYKSNYQRNPFISYKIEYLGTYTIKAFVKNNDEKIQSETVFVANKRTSPHLAVRDIGSRVSIIPITESINGKIWRFDIKEPIAEDATYSWYIYNSAGELIYKQLYTKYSEYIHSFKESGTYYAKLFVISKGIKKSAKSEEFTVEIAN